MLKRWMSIALMLMLMLSMMAGCKSVAEDGESAAADSYVAGEENAPSTNAEQKEDGEEKEQNPSKPSTDSGNKKEESSSDQKKPADTDKDSEGGKDQDENRPAETPSEDEEEPEAPADDNGDPYADTPISKTAAKTDDGVSYYLENKIKVVSYNIRCANDPDGNSLDEREWRLEEILDRYDADIMGFQEVTESWEGRLYTMLLDEYDYEMVYRSDDGGKEANPIFYKPSKFKYMDSGHFWLSETPEEMSKGWGADHYRIVTWVKMKVRQTGAIFFYFNTHVDYKPEPQVPSAELLINRVKSISSGRGGIVTGDFNLAHSAPAYSTMCSYFADSNMATVKNTSQGTFPNYGKNKNGGNIIDYCFFTPATLKATTYKVMTDLVDGKYASDHFGVYSEIIIL